jgi:Tfp pilus assembly protein PilW
MSAPLRDARGLTLTEVTVVMVLASLVMFGLVGFYMASQTTWLDASAQALTQREATAIVASVTERAHQAGSAIVTDTGAIRRIDFYTAGSVTPFWSIWWDVAAQRVFEGPYPTPYPGATGNSTVVAFTAAATSKLVDVAVTLRSPQNQVVEVGTRAALNNRDPSLP